MKPTLPILKILTGCLLPLIFIVGTGCNATTSQQTAIQIPQESAEPFYTGTVEILQMPIEGNMDQDIKLALDITYKKDSTGQWPKTYYGSTPYPKKPINAVEVEWVPSAYYWDGDSLNSNRKVVESIPSTSNPLGWTQFSPEKDSLSKSYQIIFSASQYKDLPLKQEAGYLRLQIRINVNGGNLPDEPTEEDLLYRFNYSSQELIWITPITGSARHRSLGAKNNPALTIIK